MNPRAVLIPIAVVAVGAIAWFATTRQSEDGDLLEASGTVEATEARLGFPVPGRLATVGVHEGETVVAGQELARLDTAEIEARRRQTAAQVEAARALLEELEHGSRAEEVAAARAGAEAARQRLADAERDLERARRLHEGGAISQEALDKADLAHQIAASQRTQAEEQRRLVESGPRSERIAAQRAQLAQAEAAAAAVDAALDQMVVRAPFGGIVTVRHREPGETVGGGAAVLTLLNPAERWVRIFVPETRIGEVHPGDAAEITTDTDPERIYPGEVTYIAAEAEFTPKSVQTREERVKLVYAVKVRIAGDAAGDLKPGMPADVRLRAAVGSGAGRSADHSSGAGR